MTAALAEWIELLLRWAHVMVAILWIGTSFLFIWLDDSLRRRSGQPEGLAGDSWLVHGGGFYRAEKYRVAPDGLPAELHWFRYEAYLTWVSGFLLLAVVYYLGAESYLIDREKLDLAPWQAIVLSAGSLVGGWVVYDLICKSPLGRRTGPLAAAVFALIAAAAYFYLSIFTDRAAFLHVGAFIGTLMAASVFFVIIPNQRVAVAELMAGRRPDPALGEAAKQRSLHNNYLTLPVVFFMISGHYPLVFSHEWSWAMALAIVAGGALARHAWARIEQTGLAGLGGPGRAALVGAALIAILLIGITPWRPQPPDRGEAVSFAEAQAIVAAHCTACHAARPSHPAFAGAPAGLALETPHEMRRHAAAMRRQAVLSRAMPLGNETGMTDAERARLGTWIAQGARID
jgi:uncharacterized membrane protein